ncbi:MAG: VOC family protein [Sporolactobacillus sp.]
MAIQSIMHISFYTQHLAEMREFYEHNLGATPKVIVRNGVYKGVKNRGNWAKLAETDPNGIAYMFEELAPGQFLELFPTNQKIRPDATTEVDPLGIDHYTHFSLLVDDIQQIYTAFQQQGVPIDVAPNIGNSHTWQMWTHDPDGNKIEIMQYTKDSFELTGHIDSPKF